MSHDQIPDNAKAASAKKRKRLSQPNITKGDSVTNVPPDATASNGSQIEHSGALTGSTTRSTKLSTQQSHRSSSVRPLTRGEMRALQALARASTAKEAAAMLGTTEQTLRNLLARGFKKLEVNNRTAAFRRLGWLRAPALIPLDPEHDEDPLEE